MLKSPSELNYRYPLNIPEGKSGKVEIIHTKHPKGESFTIISMRDAIMTGKAPFKVKYDMPVMITALKEDDAIWMTDLPVEREDAHEALIKCKGNVLVGGLGLGYFIKKLQEKEDVTRVDIIEISKDVIKLVWKHLKLDTRFNIINIDIHQWLKGINKPKPTYDWVYLDIWRADGEAEFINTVLPLKRKIKRFLTVENSRILSWKEATMLGQFRNNLYSNTQTRFREIIKMPRKRFGELKKDKWMKIYYPFWDMVRTNHLTSSEARELINPYIQWIADGMYGKFKNE